jgi:hypothetical protein
LEAYATGTDGKDADEIGAGTTRIAGTTGLIELPAVGGGTQVAAPAAATFVVVTAATSTAIVVVLVVVLVVALLAVALLGASRQPLVRALGPNLLLPNHGQRPEQGQTRHQPPQQPAAAPGRLERSRQSIEGGRIHGNSSGQQAWWIADSARGIGSVADRQRGRPHAALHGGKDREVPMNPA